MKHKILALACTLIFAMTIVGCGENKETTLSGMAVSVEGTVVTLQQFDSEMQNGERPEMSNGELPEGMEIPEGMEGFEGLENFNPEDFAGEMPEGMELPEDMEMPGFGSMFAGGETTEIDLAEAHISVEFDGGKATGSMEDITTGSFLTITMNKKGEATNVLVSSSMLGFN